VSDPEWVEWEIVIEAHDDALRTFGGLPGFDGTLLRGPLERPKTAYHYRDPKPDIVGLAAIYLHAICKAHAFTDGNKRTAFSVCELFLMDNGYSFDPPEGETEDFLDTVADDKNTGITEADVAAWIRKYAKPAS
jgi:death-on-curing protein